MSGRHHDMTWSQLELVIYFLESSNELFTLQCLLREYHFRPHELSGYHKKCHEVRYRHQHISHRSASKLHIHYSYIWKVTGISESPQSWEQSENLLPMQHLHQSMSQLCVDHLWFYNCIQHQMHWESKWQEEMRLYWCKDLLIHNAQASIFLCRYLSDFQPSD
jgi:hypothetical protein